GRPLRSIALKGFEDTEDIAWLGDDRFAIIEERSGAVVLLRLPDKADRVHRHDGRVLVIPGGASPENRGSEGLTYDALTDTLYAVHEGQESLLMTIEAVHGEQPRFVPLRMVPAVGTDLAGIHFDAGLRRLLVLSERAQRISEISPTGAQLFARRRIA